MVEDGWIELEAWLRHAFGNRKRKTGAPLVDHSLRVGRRLKREGQDPLTVFAGYCHDVLEDLPVELATLEALATRTLGSSQSGRVAARLVQQVSYTDGEYELPKVDRKAAAAKRWLASEDRRVALIKIADVDDNDSDADQVSDQFAKDYRSWALPLRDGLKSKWDLA